MYTFFGSFYNQDYRAIGHHIGKPNSEGIVNYIKRCCSPEEASAYAAALRRLNSAGLSEDELSTLIFKEFESSIDPTLPGFPDDEREGSLRSWIDKLSKLLEA